MKIITTYRKYIQQISIINLPIRWFLNHATTYIGIIKYKFYFPKNYIRQWKLEMVREKYEPETVALYYKIFKSGMVVVDIGAHIGYYTKIFSKLVGGSGHVYAFEADPNNFVLLQKNTSRLNNVTIKEIAISDHVGEITFYQTKKTGCNSTVPVEKWQNKIAILATDLDTTLVNKNVVKVDLIKMDIEGGEPVAIRGMLNTLTNNPDCIIITEVSLGCLTSANSTPEIYLNQLSGLGFLLFLITETGLKLIDPKDSSKQGFFTGSDFVNIICSRKNLEI